MAKQQPPSWKNRILFIVVLSGVLLLAAYVLLETLARHGIGPAEIKREATEVLEGAKGYATDKRKALQQSLAAEADEIQKELNKLEAHAARSTQEIARQSTQEMQQVLARQLETIEARLRELRAKSATLSDETRAAMDARIQDMERQKDKVLDNLAALKGAPGGPPPR